MDIQTVIVLFTEPSTSPLAKAELKKIMVSRGVRKTIVDQIIPKVFGTSIEEKGIALDATSDPTMTHETVHEEGLGQVEVVYVRRSLPRPLRSVHTSRLLLGVFLTPRTSVTDSIRSRSRI